MLDKDIEWIKSMLTEMSSNQTKMQCTVSNIETKLNNVHLTVVGDDKYGHKGLVKEVSDLKEYVEKDRMIKNKLVGGGVVIGVIWTLLLQFWKDIFSK